MKVTIKEEPKVFTPITLELIIESEEELCNLHYRMGIWIGDVNNYSCLSELKHKFSNSTTPFREKLDGLIKEYNLKK